MAEALAAAMCTGNAALQAITYSLFNLAGGAIGFTIYHLVRRPRRG